MDIKAIAAVALDELNLVNVEDANKGFFATTAKKNFNAPAPAMTPKTPKTETSQAQNSAQKPLGQQLFDLAKHDKSKHGGHFDPNTMSCKFRKEMAKSMTAMGLAIPEQVKQQLGEKNLEAAKQEGANLQQNDERVKAIQNLTKERNKVLEDKGKDSPEYKKAVEDVFNARMDFARQMIGNEEVDAGEGLVEIATDNSNPQKQEKAKSKVGELFDKAMNGEFNEAQNAELLAIGSKMGLADKCKALEDKLFQPDSGVNQEQMAGNVKENEQNEAIQEQMRVASAQNELEEPEESEEAPRSAEEPQNTPEQQAEVNQPAEQVPEGAGSDLPQAETAQEESEPERPQAKKINPEGDPDEQHLQALEETISELDMDSQNGELSEYEKDVRHAAIANRAAKYLDSWRDLDDPEKRQRAVELALQDIAKDEADGKHIGLPGENDTFQVSANQNRSDLSKAVDKAREHLNKVMGDKNASSEERQHAREAFNAAKQAAEERGSNPTEEDLYEDQNSAKEELDKANGDLEAANKQLEQAEAALKTAQQTEPKDKTAIDNAKQAVEAANNAVSIAEQAKSEAEEKYNNAKDAFENYQPPVTQEQRDAEVNINSTAEMFEKAGIDAEVVQRFRETQNMLNADPQFYAKHPELLSGLKQDAEAWMRIKTDNEAMNGMLNSLKTVAAAEISKGRIKNAVNDYLKDVMNSGDKELAQAAKEAQLKIAGGADPEKVKDEYDKKVRAIKAEQRKDELHQAAMREKNAKAYTAEANANQADAQAEAKTSKMQSDAAKSAAQAFAAEQKNKDDHMDQTWAEANAEGRLDDLDAAIETLNKRKDDYGKAAAARLADIRKKLGESHSGSQTAKLLKEWSSIVGGDHSKSRKDTSGETPVQGVDHDNGGVLDGDSGATYSPVDTSVLSNVADTKGTLTNENQAKNHIASVCNSYGMNNPQITIKHGGPVTKMSIDMSGFTGDPFALGKKIVTGIGNVIGVNDSNGKPKDSPIVSYDENVNKLTVSFPNDTKGAVSFKGIMDEPNADGTGTKWGDFKKKNEGRGAFLVGRDDNDEPIFGTMDDLVHLMIAGTTGSGKSVRLNTLISSALEANSPDDLRLILIDPKQVEFSSYRNDPHLIGDVVTDMDEAAGKFNWAVNEMENRYSLLNKAGVKNVQQYQDLAKAGKLPPGLPKKLPRIGLVVDEFADLIDTNKAEVERAIKRLGQKARAAGIHLILATQRPDVNTVSGTIKANVPSRMGLHVTNGQESNIIGVKGADEIAPKGPFVLKMADGNYVRGEGAMISNEDNEKLINASRKAYGGRQQLNKNTTGDGSSSSQVNNQSSSARSSSSNEQSKSPRISRNEGESDAEYIKRLEAALNGGNG